VSGGSLAESAPDSQYFFEEFANLCCKMEEIEVKLKQWGQIARGKRRNTPTKNVKDNLNDSLS